MADKIWVDVVKRTGQASCLSSLLLMCTSIKWRRPEDVSPLLAVTTTTSVLQLVATACEYSPLFHPSTRTFKSAMAVYRDAVEDITERTSLFDAVSSLTVTLGKKRVAQSCCMAILLVAVSCTLVYYYVGLTIKKMRQSSASQPLLKLAIYGAFLFTVFRLFGHSVLIPFLHEAFTHDLSLAAQKLAVPLRAVSVFQAIPRCAKATRAEGAYLALQGAAVSMKVTALLWDAPAAFADVDREELVDLLRTDVRPASAILCAFTLLALAYGLRKDFKSLFLFLVTSAAFTPFAVHNVWADYLEPAQMLSYVTSIQLALLFATMTLCGTPLLMFSGLLLNALFRLHGVEFA